MLRATLRRLLAVDDPPERTALAFSVGVFIAFSPLLGLHTIMATVFAFAFRFNKVAIYAGTFINNPFLTLVPIILASYALGALLMGRPLALPAESRELFTHAQLFSGGYWHKVFGQGWQILLPFAVGGTVLSVVCSIAAYPLTLRLLRARRASKSEARQSDEAAERTRDD